MLPTATISSPNTATATSKTPKQQNRKSGVSVTLHKQNNNNMQQSSGRSNNRQPRSTAQTHARHQSMPAQQRPSPSTPAGSPPSNIKGNHPNNNNNNSSNVTIMKRSSATMAAPIPTPIISNIQLLQNQASPKQQQRNQKSRSQGQNQSQQNNNNPASKQKTRKGRKDLDTSGSESMIKADATDAGSNQSPTLNPSSPPSSTDSDDSESATSHRTYKESQRRQNGQFPKGYAGPLLVSPPQRPNSAPVMPQSRKGMVLSQKQQQQGNRKSGFSTTPNPADAGDGGRPNVTKTASADKIMLADRIAEKKSTLYAGPTFHNSPAPASLPIPAFARSWGNSPIEPAVEKLPVTTFFAEAASPQLNSLRPQRTLSETSGWTAHHSMPVQNFNMGYSYQVPEHMATSGYPVDGPVMHGSDQLMEISQNIRNLLKIQSQ
ncbi:hypothetical protein FBU30_007512 [Linnemannia zychae]|nr:hypothetical protein FBU30_007512 [Linnemannia zychae]